MFEDIAIIFLWVAFSLLALWGLLRFMPHLVRFFRGEILRAKDKVVNPEDETMVIKVMKEKKKENSREQ